MSTTTERLRQMAEDIEDWDINAVTINYGDALRDAANELESAQKACAEMRVVLDKTKSVHKLEIDAIAKALLSSERLTATGETFPGNLVHRAKQLIKERAELRSKLNAANKRIAELVECVRANHKWHQDYDYYGGYPDSELCEKNVSALKHGLQ